MKLWLKQKCNVLLVAKQANKKKLQRLISSKQTFKTVASPSASFTKAVSTLSAGRRFQGQSFFTEFFLYFGEKNSFKVVAFHLHISKSAAYKDREGAPELGSWYDFILTLDYLVNLMIPALI